MIIPHSSPSLLDVDDEQYPMQIFDVHREKKFLKGQKLETLV
jgi:hypothetical protein